MSDSIIVSPVIEENNGLQKVKGWNVHYGEAAMTFFKTKKKAFLFAHTEASKTLQRVTEKGIHKPKLDTEKM